MSIPTITSITPTQGPTLGDFSVGIVGTNFRMPSLGVTQGNTVAVTVDGKEVDAQVFDATFIVILMPEHDTGKVDIVVQNLDDDGAPIAGEVATFSQGFTYLMPIMTTDNEGDLARVVRVLIREIKKKFMAAEVTYAVSTDYDEVTGDELHVTKFAKLPGISLMGPDLVENRFYSINDQPSISDPASQLDEENNPIGFVTTRVPYTVDLLFVLIAASDNKSELLNMMANFTMFMHHTKFLVMDRDADDPSKGSVKYEMDFQPEGHPRAAMSANNSNVRSFEAKIVIRGFDIEAVSGVEAGSTAGVPNQAIVSRGNTSDGVQLDTPTQLQLASRVGPSPGQ